MGKGWRDITRGALIFEPGSSVAYETGTWRAVYPVIDMAKCNYCLDCWIYCPDGSIIVENSRIMGIDLKHCKGCGICAKECPQQAITMAEECKE